jgi:hypothetical protein
MLINGKGNNMEKFDTKKMTNQVGEYLYQVNHRPLGPYRTTLHVYQIGRLNLSRQTYGPLALSRAY